ncbi:MAG: cytochrome c maturation protein CcmE [Cyclobacteriaceae bacterium]
MKLTHIIALIVLIISIVIVVFTLNDASTYADFATAQELGMKEEGAEVHIVGELKKDGAGNIVGMSYQPTVDENLFKFVLIDENQREEEVIYFAPKPADMDKSEKVVIVASYVKGKFIAKKILLKCPSKYTEEEIKEAT